jgi:hypothetical protein
MTRIELNGTVNGLLDELKMDFEAQDYMIVIDSEENMIGNHDVLDGNHRLAILVSEDRLQDAYFVQISGTELSKKGLLEGNEKKFLDYVRKNAIVLKDEVEII